MVSACYRRASYNGKGRKLTENYASVYKQEKNIEDL